LEKVRTNCFLNFQTSSPVQKVKKKEKALVARSNKEFERKQQKTKDVFINNMLRKKSYQKKHFIIKKKEKKLI
jgi:hypothetical protein